MTLSVSKSATKIRERKLIRQWHITILCVATNVTMLLLRGDFWRGAEAGILFNKTTTYLKLKSGTFLDAAAGSSGGSLAAGGVLKTTVDALIDLVPWALILIVAGISASQAYNGYKQYEQEDLGGMVKSILSVLILILFVVMASFVTDFLVSGN
jgi:hypothetical protein